MPHGIACPRVTPSYEVLRYPDGTTVLTNARFCFQDELGRHPSRANKFVTGGDESFDD